MIWNFALSQPSRSGVSPSSSFFFRFPMGRSCLPLILGRPLLVDIEIKDSVKFWYSIGCQHKFPSHYSVCVGNVCKNPKPLFLSCQFGTLGRLFPLTESGDLVWLSDPAPIVLHQKNIFPLFWVNGIAFTGTDGEITHLNTYIQPWFDWFDMICAGNQKQKFFLSRRLYIHKCSPCKRLELLRLDQNA